MKSRSSGSSRGSSPAPRSTEGGVARGGGRGRGGGGRAAAPAVPRGRLARSQSTPDHTTTTTGSNNNNSNATAASTSTSPKKNTTTTNNNNKANGSRNVAASNTGGGTTTEPPTTHSEPVLYPVSVLGAVVLAVHFLHPPPPAAQATLVAAPSIAASLSASATAAATVKSASGEDGCDGGGGGDGGAAPSVYWPASDVSQDLDFVLHPPHVLSSAGGGGEHTGSSNYNAAAELYRSTSTLTVSAGGGGNGGSTLGSVYSNLHGKEAGAFNPYTNVGVSTSPYNNNNHNNNISNAHNDYNYYYGAGNDRPDYTSLMANSSSAGAGVVSSLSHLTSQQSSGGGAALYSILSALPQPPRVPGESLAARRGALLCWIAECFLASATAALPETLRACGALSLAQQWEAFAASVPSAGHSGLATTAASAGNSDGKSSNANNKTAFGAGGAARCDAIDDGRVAGFVSSSGALHLRVPLLAARAADVSLWLQNVAALYAKHTRGRWRADVEGSALTVCRVDLHLRLSLGGCAPGSSSNSGGIVPLNESVVVRLADNGPLPLVPREAPWEVGDGGGDAEAPFSVFADLIEGTPDGAAAAAATNNNNDNTKNGIACGDDAQHGRYARFLLCCLDLSGLPSCAAFVRGGGSAGGLFEQYLPTLESAIAARLRQPLHFETLLLGLSAGLGEPLDVSAACRDLSSPAVTAAALFIPSENGARTSTATATITAPTGGAEGGGAGGKAAAPAAAIARAHAIPYGEEEEEGCTRVVHTLTAVIPSSPALLRGKNPSAGRATSPDRRDHASAARRVAVFQVLDRASLYSFTVTLHHSDGAAVPQLAVRSNQFFDTSQSSFSSPAASAATALSAYTPPPVLAAAAARPFFSTYSPSAAADAHKGSAAAPDPVIAGGVAHTSGSSYAAGLMEGGTVGKDAFGLLEVQPLAAALVQQSVADMRAIVAAGLPA